MRRLVHCDVTTDLSYLKTVLECSSCNCILKYFIHLLKNQCRAWARIFHDTALLTSRRLWNCIHICITAEESVRAVWVRWKWYYVINGWCSAVLSHWDVVLVNVPCVLGLSSTNIGYCLLWKQTLSLAVSVFPHTHFPQTPVCDHYGSLPLPVPERSKVILNPPRHFQSKHI